MDGTMSEQNQSKQEGTSANTLIEACRAMQLECPTVVRRQEQAVKYAQAYAQLLDAMQQWCTSETAHRHTTPADENDDVEKALHEAASEIARARACGLDFSTAENEAVERCRTIDAVLQAGNREWSGVGAVQELVNVELAYEEVRNDAITAAGSVDIDAQWMCSVAPADPKRLRGNGAWLNVRLERQGASQPMTAQEAAEIEQTLACRRKPHQAHRKVRTAPAEAAFEWSYLFDVEIERVWRSRIRGQIAATNARNAREMASDGRVGDNGEQIAGSIESTDTVGLIRAHSRCWDQIPIPAIQHYGSLLEPARDAVESIARAIEPVRRQHTTVQCEIAEFANAIQEIAAHTTRGPQSWRARFAACDVEVRFVAGPWWERADAIACAHRGTDQPAGIVATISIDGDAQPIRVVEISLSLANSAAPAPQAWVTQRTVECQSTAATQSEPGMEAVRRALGTIAERLTTAMQGVLRTQRKGPENSESRPRGVE